MKVRMYAAWRSPFFFFLLLLLLSFYFWSYVLWEADFGRESAWDNDGGWESRESALSRSERTYQKLDARLCFRGISGRGSCFVED